MDSIFQTGETSTQQVATEMNNSGTSNTTEAG